MSFRLAQGGLIDRGTRLALRYDGRDLAGHAGDTLASALLANGVRLVGRSFKYHRPRGILSAGVEEPNALMTLGHGARREPNSRATTVELKDGLVAESQNRWPTLGFDLLAVNQLAAPFIAAGFYYKTFMWPPRFWEKLYEPLIRRAAGLGRASRLPDPDHYERATLHCDLLVVGGGPAGLMAALAAGQAGLRVVLCDEDFRFGGRLNAERFGVGGQSGADWAALTVAALAALPSVRLMARCTVVGAYDHGTYAAVEKVTDHLARPDPTLPRQRLWRIVASRAVVAAGAIERPLVFGNNDRPGVMLAGAVRAYVNRFAVAPGRRAVIFSSHDDGARTLADLIAAGIEVAALVEARETVSPQTAALAKRAGTRLFTSARIVSVTGRHGVTAAEVADASGGHVVPCDLVAMGGGWSPTLHLATHLGQRPQWDARQAVFRPGPLPDGMAVAGAAAGVFDLAGCLASGAEAGRAAAAGLGVAVPASELPETETVATAGTPFWRVADSRGKAFVDFQNDVTDTDIALAEREGYRHAELAKRYTTLGMATDQGKTSGVNGMAILAEARGVSLDGLGATTFRPPFSPVSIGALAGPARGREFRPSRLPPSHAWAARHGAAFTEVGPWQRARWFTRGGEGWLDSVGREVLATRGGAGCCDVSTLGKIELCGPDVATLLERVYVNHWAALPVGRTRYGLMLREDGFVLDDGTTARLAEDFYVMTTTSANGAKVLAHLDFCHQVLWPELDVAFTSVTDQWAQFAVAGPRSRAVLESVLAPDCDISDAALPYLAAATMRLRDGTDCRVFRISFSGERGFELAVPAALGEAVWEGLVAGGATPYGTEAMTVMRVEKGHVATGELNGQTTAGDLGMGRMLSTRKDFVGRAMAARPGLTDPARPSLVGLKPLAARSALSAGAHLLAPGAAAETGNDLGYVTSVAWSPTLSSSIALALLSGGRARIGERLRAWDGVRGGDIAVEVVDPCFLDREGERLRG